MHLGRWIVAGIGVLAEVHWRRREVVVAGVDQMPGSVDTLGSERRRRSLFDFLVEVLARHCQTLSVYSSKQTGEEPKSY